MTLQKKNADGTWSDVTDTRLASPAPADEQGHFHFGDFQQPQYTTATYRAVWGGSDKYNAGMSREILVIGQYPPSAVRELVVLGSGKNYIRIGWKLPTKGGTPTSFKCQNSMYPYAGLWSVGATVGQKTTMYTYSNLKSKKTYRMRVLSQNADGTAGQNYIIYWTTK